MRNHQLDISGRLHTGDPNLTCALLTCGVPLVQGNEVTKVKGDRGDFLRFNFMSRTIDGTKGAGELFAAWEAGENHIRRFPEDGMSYCMAFSMNRVQLLDLIHRQIPQVMVRKGSQIALISENASPRLEAEILGRIR